MDLCGGNRNKKREDIKMSTITVKLTDKQQAALIWAINIFEMSYEGGSGDDAIDADHAAALKALAPIYAKAAANA